MLFILSKPVGWNLDIDEIVASSDDGELAVRSGLAELLNIGFLHRRILRNKGRVIGTDWTTVNL